MTFCGCCIITGSAVLFFCLKISTFKLKKKKKEREKERKLGKCYSEFLKNVFSHPHNQ